MTDKFPRATSAAKTSPVTDTIVITSPNGNFFSGEASTFLG